MAQFYILLTGGVVLTVFLSLLLLVARRAMNYSDTARETEERAQAAADGTSYDAPAADDYLWEWHTLASELDQAQEFQHNPFELFQLHPGPFGTMMEVDAYRGMLVVVGFE